MLMISLLRLAQFVLVSLEILKPVLRPRLQS
jgi:hypothetical protein